MRPRVAPAPPLEEVGERALHALVRDYPEALGALAAAGIDVRGSGGSTAFELGMTSEVAAALASRLAWRELAHEKGATRPRGSPPV